MGIMNSLRNRAGLLVGAIGFAIVAFLAGDAITTGRPFWEAAQNNIGEVAGEAISYKDFDARLQQNIEQYKQSSGQTTTDDNTTGYLVDQTWNQVVNEMVLNTEIAKLGVKVSAEELFDMIQGKNPHPQVRQAFSNPQTGMFDPAVVLNFLKTMDERDPSGDTRRQWLAFEKGIYEERLRQKYFNLVKAGLYVTTSEAKESMEAQARTATIKYVMLDYFSIPDSAVKVSESDIEKYYNANKYKYKQKETQRSFDYVVFDVNPSLEDSVEAKKWIDEKTAALRTSTDDSTFISLNAETAFTGEFRKKGQLSPSLDTTIFNSSIGTVYGPYIEGNAYKVAKLMSVKFIPDSVNARHILLDINKEGGIAKAQAKADSLKKLIVSGANFAELAKTNSSDGSASKGGDLGTFGDKQMVKPFSDACFFGKTGDLTIVTSQFGIHIIEIMNQKNPTKAVQVGVIDRLIEPSSVTQQMIYEKANSVLSTIKDVESFEKAVGSQNLTKRAAENVKENDKFINGLEKPREIIRWAYEADKDDFSPLFDLGNKYVFARLTQIKEKGTTPLEYVKTEVEALVKKEKKAEMLSEKLTKAQDGANTIDVVAQKVAAVVQPATSVSFAYPVIPGVAREAKVIGTVFGTGKNKMTKPIDGERGVYVVFVETMTEPTPSADYSFNKMQLLNPIKQRADYEASEALKEMSDVVDNRIRFY